MWALVENEILKFTRSKKFLIFILSLTIVFIYGGFSVYHEANGKRPENLIDSNNKTIAVLRENLRYDNFDGDKDEILKNIESLEKQNETYQKEISNMFKDKDEYIRGKIAILENQKKNKEIESDTIKQEEIRGKLEYYNYVSTNNFNPKREYEINAFEDISKVISTVSIILIPILIIFAASDLVSGEYDASTIKLLLAKPISRAKIIISKFISSILIIITTITIFELATFLILGFSIEFGNYNAPILVGTKYTFQNSEASAVLGSTYLMEAWKVIAITWLLQVVFIISSVAFALLLSTLFKNTVTSLGISAIAVAIFSLLTFFMPFPFMKNIYPLVFTTYSSGLDILTGSLNMNLGNSSISITFGIVTMILWAIFSFVASYKIFTTEDVLT
jgi:ABC-2 type transport system permease protein